MRDQVITPEGAEPCFAGELAPRQPRQVFWQLAVERRIIRVGRSIDEARQSAERAGNHGAQQMLRIIDRAFWMTCLPFYDAFIRGAYYD
jgi:hypothetical protein